MIIAVLQKLLPKTLEKVQSPLNGEISVVEQFGKRKIVVGKLTQSGPVMEEIWRETVKIILKKYCSSESENFSLRSKNIWIPDQSLPSTRSRVGDDSGKIRILILGLGGGSIIKVLEKYFPKTKITAIDYDPIMVRLGKKYLGLKESKNLKIIIGDAKVFLNKKAVRHSGKAAGRLQNQKNNGFWTSQNDETLFDLIFVDLFSGETIPKKTQTKLFLRKIKEKLAKNGLVVFNRHYYQNHISEARIFLDKLKKIFDDVDSKRILTNLLIFCRK